MSSEFAGGDDLWAELTGPVELLRLVGVPEGSGSGEAGDSGESGCTHLRFPVRVSTAGDYALSLVLLYERYAALDERISEAPRGVLQDLLGGGARIRIGDGSGPQRSNGSALYAAARRLLRRGSGVPACGAGVPEPGRWVAQRGWLQPPSWPRSGWPVPKRLPPRALQWAPYDCRPPRFSVEAGRACLRGRYVMLSGDSHTRTLFNALLRRFGGSSGSAAKKDLLTSQCRTPPALPGARLCYKSDRFGREAEGELQELLRAQRERARAGGPLPVLIFGFGQHPASGRRAGHFTLERYAQDVRERVGAAAARLGGAQPEAILLWMSPQELNPAPDKFKAYSADWRTPSRMQLFARVAKEEVAAIAARYPRVQLRQVDALNVSLALDTAAEDGAHIALEGFQDALADKLLSLICGGGSGEGGRE